MIIGLKLWILKIQDNSLCETISVIKMMNLYCLIIVDKEKNRFKSD